MSPRKAMAYLQYALTSLVVGIGVVLGLLIGLMAKEELKQGNKYFNLMQLVTFVLAFFVVAYARLSLVPALLIGFAAIVVGGLLLRAQLDYAIFLIFAILFYLGSSTGTFALLAALIFMYALPTGSVFLARKNCTSSVLYLSAIFILVSNILFIFIQNV